MKTHLLRRGGLLAAVVACAVFVSADPASAAAGDGSAYGVKVNVTLLGAPAVNVGPLAAATTAGTTANSLATVSVPGVVSAGVINTSATFDPATGAVTSHASTANFGLPVLQGPLGTVNGGVIEATCSATQQGVTGSSNLVNVNLGSLGTVPANPTVNTVLNVKVAVINIATVTLNEQIHNPDGSLTVNAVHIKLLGGVLGSLGSGDIIVSSATCGPAGLPIPLASGAGMWIAFGLLGVIALPVGTRFIRNRRSATAA